MTTCRSQSRRLTFDRERLQEADFKIEGHIGERDGSGEKGHLQKRETGERIATRYRQKAKATVLSDSQR